MKNHVGDIPGRLRRFEALCRERGLALTVQRRTILEALLGREDHPTADQIYDEVKDRLPGLSRTTVYRVLETLVDLGVISKPSHLGPAARFDAKTERHHHLVCARCGRVADYESASLDDLPLPDGERVGFEVTGYSVHFSGICAACREERRVKGEERRVQNDE